MSAQKRKVVKERRLILKHADDPKYSNGISVLESRWL